MGSEEKKNATGRFLVQMHPSRFVSSSHCHFQLISVVKIRKNVADDKKSSFIFCTQFGGENATESVSYRPFLYI